MSSKIEPSLFEFVDEFAISITQGDIRKAQPVAPGEPLVTFCESFFEQFFENAVDTPILGISRDSKDTAAGIAERLKRRHAPQPLRTLVALFEQFCDLYEDMSGDYSGGALSYGDFAGPFVGRLLRRGEEWARADGDAALADRIKLAKNALREALKTMAW